MKLRKAISALMSAVMLTGVLIGGNVEAASSMPFKDVSSKKWYYSYVKSVWEKGLMDGMGDGYFEPDSGMTRAMFVTVLGRMAGVEDSKLDNFKDTKKDTWYSRYVGWAAEKGIVNGYDDGTFLPDKNLTRSEMATIISRYIEAMGINMPRKSNVRSCFADNDSIPKWAAQYINDLRTAGIVNGDENGNYNPKDDNTRAEMAKIICALATAESEAWQGYAPSFEKDGYAVYGAKYLYWNGSVVAGGLGTELKSGEELEYPALEAYTDADSAENTYLPADTVGISFSAIGNIHDKCPIIKLCYKYADSLSEEPSVYLYSNGVSLGNADVSAGATDEGWRTLLIDISKIMSENPMAADKSIFTQLLFKPFSDDDGDSARFYIRYIAMFENETDATLFESRDKHDYLKDYFLYSDVEIQNATDSVLSEYDALLSDRVKEILDSESEITPEMITANGGTCYYLSSINGDDSNSGTSPDKPWKSLSKLRRRIGNTDLYIDIPKNGDGVFFERGSVWYPEVYNNYSKTTLELAAGVSYGAYGIGEKPMFTGALDLGGGTGTWYETEWENIYVLDDEQLDAREDFRGEYKDVGMIVFDEGKNVGVSIIPSDRHDPFGDGSVTVNDFIYYNGTDCYYVSPRSCGDPGEALLHDLEFIHDWKNGKLYLYSADGNPSDRFDRIMIGTKTYTVHGEGDGIRIDNICAKYSCYGLLDVGGDNVEISNCEAGYSCGSESSIDGSIGAYGSFDGYTIRNCYSHDIGDGGVTHQNTSYDKAWLKNITYENNVIAACGIGIETWLHMGSIDKNGYAQNVIENVTVRGNIIAYCGYGLTQVQGGHANYGAVVDSSIYGEFDNCIIEDNVFMHSTGSVFRGYLSTDLQNRGWSIGNNTYIFNSDCANFTYMYETMPYTIDHGMNKKLRIFVPYSERYIKYYASLGAFENGEFYIYNGLSENEQLGSFYISGYEILHADQGKLHG